MTGRDTFLADVIEGLGTRPRSLPAKYFYDGAGSALFEEITRLPEYYPTRTEIGILRAHRDAISARIPDNAALVEFGSGSSTKIRLLLEAAPQLAAYVPVDVSAGMLGFEADALAADFPAMIVAPVAADFTRPFGLPAELSTYPRVGFFPGSTIGNLDPEDARAFLAGARELLGPGGVFVVGVDLVKDVRVLERAYDDAAGITARFNLNLLRRINAELGADFDLHAFSHRALFDPVRSRVEMHLVSLRDQIVRLGDLDVEFTAGETIHTENSYKYTPEGFGRLAAAAGWRQDAVWTDDGAMFSVHLLA